MKNIFHFRAYQGSFESQIKPFFLLSDWPNVVFNNSFFAKDIKNKSESAETHRLELPKSNWGKVCAAFISEYDYELYKYWLESLSVEQTAATIELSTSSGMVRDRIEQNYMPFLSEVAQSTGINKIILI